jgi:hypothetical protein
MNLDNYLIFEIVKILEDVDLYNFLLTCKRFSNIFNLNNLTKNYLEYRKKNCLQNMLFSIKCDSENECNCKNMKSYISLYDNHWINIEVQYNKNNKNCYYNNKLFINFNEFNSISHKEKPTTTDILFLQIFGIKSKYKTKYYFRVTNELSNKDFTLYKPNGLMLYMNDTPFIMNDLSIEVYY